MLFEKMNNHITYLFNKFVCHLINLTISENYLQIFSQDESKISLAIFSLNQIQILTFLHTRNSDGINLKQMAHIYSRIYISHIIFFPVSCSRPLRYYDVDDLSSETVRFDISHSFCATSIYVAT